jgi:GrpB-like predicted nucleotidyltransferase (UPF0157 family)
VVRKIVIVPYDKNWPERYRLEAEKLTEIIGEQAFSIHHIGSTSISNMKAKPIIDILVEVKNIETIDELNEEMIKEGYLPKGENGIPGRRYFIKGKDVTHKHHIHMFQTGNPEIKRHLHFRDYLSTHPEEAQAYGRLKEGLAQRFPEDGLSYTIGKDEFIKKVDNKAKTWRTTIDKGETQTSSFTS